MTVSAEAIMTEEWVLRRSPLGGSSLSRALQAQPMLNNWLAPRPRSAAEWHARIAATRDLARQRDWLTPLAPAISAMGPAADRLGRAAANGVVITTGQQPGLFGGPAYTFSKAISALAMADALEASSGVPVAPIFWAATDDADWMEASLTYLATSHGLERLSLEGEPTEGVAMADVPLGTLRGALDALRRASGSIAHPSMLAHVEQAYVPHATIGDAYVQLMRALLEPLGIAVLDAAHPALRTAADPFLRTALTAAGAVDDALQQRTQEIRDAGFEPQVETVDALSLVFRTQSGVSGRQRDRVRARVPIADAARVVREADVGSLGANVLLRPVLERALLPTVAYHAGPGEYAYFAQIAPIARALSAAAPLAVPRWSGEVLETRALDTCARLGIDDAQLRDPHAAETHVARRAVRVELQDAIDRLRVAMETQVRAVRESALSDEPLVSEAVVAGFSRDVDARLQRFERRVMASVKRRDVALMREVAAVRAALRPLGDSPERKLTLMPMLARFGPSVFGAMRRDASDYAHHLVEGD